MPELRRPAAVRASMTYLDRYGVDDARAMRAYRDNKTVSGGRGSVPVTPVNGRPVRPYLTPALARYFYIDRGRPVPPAARWYAGTGHDAAGECYCGDPCCERRPRRYGAMKSAELARLAAGAGTDQQADGAGAELARRAGPRTPARGRRLADLSVTELEHRAEHGTRAIQVKSRAELRRRPETAGKWTRRNLADLTITELEHRAAHGATDKIRYNGRRELRRRATSGESTDDSAA